MSRKIVFITGGARSGKSSFAMSEASKFKGKKAYIASAEALDEEMRERIEQHKNQRGNDWDTYEEPLKIEPVIEKIGSNYNAIVLDCLTLWLSNMMSSSFDLEKEIDSFCRSLFTVQCSLFVVSNEVGMGIVPENEMARRFRDWAGWLNQKVTEVADEVYMMVAGVPVKIKG